MPSQDKLFQSTFQQEFSSPDADNVLQNAVNEFPYFIPAHFFLLKKDSENQQQATTTSLLFNNPLWLNWLLMNKEENKEAESLILSTPTGEQVSNETQHNIPESFTPYPIPVEMNDGKLTYTPTFKPVEKEEELIFEPLYASDYFASQGIKISDEIKPDDKLGKQLKSFTEWLKSMKKVEPAKTMDEVTPVDIAVQHMAEKSNKEGEVLTETMAEVFAQQGKAAKAAEVYEKLSLLNPLKSAYFAAKIEHLKSI